MILGMTTFTFVHVLLSLIGILSGLVVVFGLLGGKRLDGWTALFLVTTVLTSVTGFLFPFHKFLPSYGVGIVSLVVLAIAIFARYVRQLAGLAPWLRGQRRDCAVFECVRIDRAAFHEGASAEGHGADGVRAALFGCAAGVHGALRRAGDWRGNQVSQ